MKKKFIYCAIFLLIFSLSTIFFYFWSNAGNYKNNLHVSRHEVFKSMVNLVASSSSYSIVNNDPTTVLTYTTHDASSLNDYMNKYGWERDYQMGAVFYYSKGGKSMEVRHFSLTRFFKINKLQFTP